ncbi:integrase, catalytic region, zinc finger, CCHC-type containing protein, partial [Tanacetum coccineum]
MAAMAENVIAAGSETHPLMLEKGMYNSWKTRIILYIRGKENGEMLKDSIDNGPYQLKLEITVKDTDGVTDIRHPQRVEDIVGQDKLCYDSDIKADRVKELMEGTKMTKQECDSMLYDKFDKFTSEPGESIHLYYMRYAKLINDMKMIPMSMSNMQINTKFVNHLQPEWSRFVTIAKQARDLHSSQGYASNAGKNQALGERVVNPVGNVEANQLSVIRCYNCNGEGHIAKQCTAKKRVKDFEWFKDKMLHAQAQEARVVLNDEQQDFLADNCDDEATIITIFMVNLSPVGSINDDTIEPRYDSDIFFEVSHYDTYHDSHMLNSNIQDLGYIENIVSNNKSYDELTSNNNVISYNDYMLTIGNDDDNYVPPPVQKNDMMLSVIEQMKSQVEKWNMVEFRRISLTGFRSCTSCSHYRSVSKQTT